MTAVVEPKAITALPHGPHTNDPENFDDAADEFVAALPPMIIEQNAANAATYQNAVAAVEAATAAGQSSASASLAAQAAAGSVTDAAEQARLAKGHADRAGDSAAAAANSAATLNATSTSPQTIGVGVKVFAVQAGKQFGPNQTLKIVSPTNATQWMVATVNTYAAASLSVTVTDVSPAAAGAVVSNWFITLSGETGRQGDPGSIVGGNLTGALNGKRADTDVPSALTTDIWSGNGSFVVITGTAAITGFADAPQAGTHRRLYAAAAFTLTAGANLIIKGVQSGTSYTVAAGDEIDVYALTSTKFLVTLAKADGTPIANDRGALHNIRQFMSSGVFIAPKTGWYKITLTGASGSGGAAAASFNGQAAASGAGAGGFCSGMRFLIAGQSYVVSVGVGGVAVTAQNSATNGNAGTGSTFSGPGIISMIANGGDGGKASVAVGTINGGAGGTASGGDVNVTGGSGGPVTIAASCAGASGGGAVGLRGATFSAGAVNASNSRSAASGGAGVGGASGAVTASTADTYSAGGGCAGGTASITNGQHGIADAGINCTGSPGGGSLNGGVLNALDTANGGGGYPGLTASAPAGGGSSGQPGQASQQSGAGSFAGGGGCASSYASALGGADGGAYGGAPGGVANRQPASTTPQISYGRPGQSGTVIIEF